jgi:hypothetical protein
MLALAALVTVEGVALAHGSGTTTVIKTVAQLPPDGQAVLPMAVTGACVTDPAVRRELGIGVGDTALVIAEDLTEPMPTFDLRSEFGFVTDVPATAVDYECGATRLCIVGNSADFWQPSLSQDSTPKPSTPITRVAAEFYNPNGDGDGGWLVVEIGSSWGLLGGGDTGDCGSPSGSATPGA